MLDITASNWWVLLSALAAGAVGGFAAAMILLDPTESPNPRPTGNDAVKVVVIRTIVGAVAAAAFLFFFPTVQTTSIVASGHATITTTSYPFLKVVALALIVGTGGSAFLTAMQNQASSFVTAKNATISTAQVKATSTAWMAALPKLAGETACAEAAEHLNRLTDVGTQQITRVADGLPPTLDLPGVDTEGIVKAAFATVTGVPPEEQAAADTGSATNALLEAASPIPATVETAVTTTIQEQIEPVINEINLL